MTKSVKDLDNLVVFEQFSKAQAKAGDYHYVKWEECEGCSIVGTVMNEHKAKYSWLILADARIRDAKGEVTSYATLGVPFVGKLRGRLIPNPSNKDQELIPWGTVVGMFNHGKKVITQGEWAGSESRNVSIFPLGEVVPITETAKPATAPAEKTTLAVGGRPPASEDVAPPAGGDKDSFGFF